MTQCVTNACDHTETASDPVPGLSQKLTLVGVSPHTLINRSPPDIVRTSRVSSTPAPDSGRPAATTPIRSGFLFPQGFTQYEHTRDVSPPAPDSGWPAARKCWMLSKLTKPSTDCANSHPPHFPTPRPTLVFHDQIATADRGAQAPFDQQRATQAQSSPV